MAATGQTPVLAQSPPLMPTLKDENLSRYLSTFSTWAMNGLSGKLPSGQALPGILLQAYDPPTGTTPAVWLLRVNTAGTLSVTTVALGEGKARSTVQTPSLGAPIIIGGATIGVRVWAEDDSINSAVPNGGILQFDSIGIDTHGFAPTTSPFSQITIPPGYGGVYLLTGRSSGGGNQSTSLGMGILINSALGFRETNQTIWGPGSLNYTLDNDATQLLQLNDGDTIELKNNSVSSGSNAFTSVSMALARFT